MSNCLKRWGLFLSVVCCSFFLSSACTSINSSVAPFCSSVVNWQVPSELNISAADLNASLDSNAATTQDSTCPFYLNAQYQCYKFFPHCYESSNDTEVIVYLCTSYCLEPESGECHFYSSEFFNSECYNPNYYSSAPSCISLGSSSSAFAAWKIALICVCGAIGLGLLGSVLYSHYKEKKYDPEKDPHIDEVVTPRKSSQVAPTSEYVDLGTAMPARANREPVTLEDRERAWNASRTANIVPTSNADPSLGASPRG